MDKFFYRIYEVFQDNEPRYFVPEVNSQNQDLVAIVEYLINMGFVFINDIHK